MKMLNICKASPYTGREEDFIEGVVIEISDDLPPYDSLQKQDAFAQGQADVFEEALYNSLPGCIYDRLLGNMLARKSTHFRVSHTA